MIDFWSKTLSVFPVQQILSVPQQACSMASMDDEFMGVENADLKLYIVGVETCDGNTFAAAGSCHWDQFDRPIAGMYENIAVDATYSLTELTF